jgi:hypothetical protein
MLYNKEILDFRFSYIKNYNIEKIKKIVKNLENEWLVDHSRQDMFYVHRYTNSYIINKVSLDWKQGEPLQSINKLESTELSELALEIACDLEKQIDGKMGQVLFTKLPAKKIIDPHEDHGDYLHCVARHHIPIITNLGVRFIIDGEGRHVPEGECWEINNNKTHAVENNGEEDRIHLLIDIIPNKYLTV